MLYIIPEWLRHSASQWACLITYMTRKEYRIYGPSDNSGAAVLR